MSIDVYSLNETEFSQFYEKNYLQGLNKYQICSHFSRLNSQIAKINSFLAATSHISTDHRTKDESDLPKYPFEKIQVYSFNARAAFAGKPFEAFYREADSNDPLNSPASIIIKERSADTVLKQYYPVFTETAEEAAEYISSLNDYKNKRFLVCDKLTDEVKKLLNTRKYIYSIIEHDGVSSTPNTYDFAMEFQKAVISQDFSSMDLKKYSPQEVTFIGIKAAGHFVDLKTIFMAISMIYEQIARDFESSGKKEIADSTISVGWSAAKSGLIQSFSGEISRHAGYFPEHISNLPEKQIARTGYEIASILVDTIHAGFDFHTGVISAPECCTKIMQSALKSTCSVLGDAISAVYSSGAFPIHKVLAGNSICAAMSELIGISNFRKAAMGCVGLTGRISDTFTN